MGDDIPLALYLPAGLFLKPDPKIIIEVKLPDIKQVGVSVSNWEVMEKTKILALPELFVSLRVTNYTRDVIQFEGELESTRVMRKVILLVDGKSIKLSGFSEVLKVRARLKDVPHPTKQEWEDHFTEHGMELFDEERPGERPDTVIVKGLPVKWFVSRASEGQPCPRILTQAFQKFGRVREVGIYQTSLSLENSKSFSSFGPGTKGLHFEAFIQYEKYTAFCNAMNNLKGMKLIRLEEGGKEATAIIREDFDRSAYLSDRNIRKRLRMEERKRMTREAEEKEIQQKKMKEEEAEEEQRKKEEGERTRKRAKKLEERRQRKEEQVRIVAELKAVAHTRREEAQHLLSVLLAGAAEARYQEEQREQREADERRERERKEEARVRKEKERARRLEEESNLREQLIKNVKELEQKKLEVQRQLLLRTMDTSSKDRGQNASIKSVVIPKAK